MALKSRAVVLKVNSIGDLITGFNGGIGKSFGYGFGNTRGEAVAIHNFADATSTNPDILVAGHSYGTNAGLDGKLFLMRLNHSNGTYDKKLAGQGFAVRSLPTTTNHVTEINGLHITGTGHAVVSGSVKNVSGKSMPFLAKFNDRGVLDHTFGEEGIVYGVAGRARGPLAAFGDTYAASIKLPAYNPPPSADNVIRCLVYRESSGIAQTIEVALSVLDTEYTHATRFDSAGNLYVAGNGELPGGWLC